MASVRRPRAVSTATVAPIVLVVSMVGARRTAADEPRVPAAAALVARGLEAGYNLDHAEAFTAFEQCAAAHPIDPRCHRLTAAAAWIGILFEQGAVTVDDYLGQARADVARGTPRVVLAQAFHSALRQAVTINEERLRHRASEGEAHYQVGAAYGVLASYTATVDGRVMASLGPARRAYREHQRTLELDPQRKDAGLIVGTYRYVVASLSPPMRLLARLAGFGADRALALRLVEGAAAYPSDVQPNALFTLLLMYNREARYDDALRVIGELQRRFPRNRLLWLEAGSTALRAGRPADAKAVLEEGLALLSRDPRPRAQGEEARWAYAYGASLVAVGETAAATRQLRRALSGAPRDWVQGRIHKELGKLADLAGDRRQALVEYRRADGLCRQGHDSDCASEVKPLMKTAYR